MKKMILATVACVFLATPVLATEFNVAQTKVLDKLASNMEKFKDDAPKMDLLTQKKECVEKATDIDTLKVCLTKYSPEQLQAIIK